MVMSLNALTVFSNIFESMDLQKTVLISVSSKDNDAIDYTVYHVNTSY